MSTVLRSMVHRGAEYGLKVPVRYRFCCREQLGKKDTEFNSSIVLLQNFKMKPKKVIVDSKLKKNVSF